MQIITLPSLCGAWYFVFDVFLYSCTEFFLRPITQIANTIFYGLVIFMIYSKDIRTLITENEQDLTIDDLRSIAFLCESLAQDREMEITRKSDDDARRFFYTGE